MTAALLFASISSMPETSALLKSSPRNVWAVKLREKLRITDSWHSGIQGWMRSTPDASAASAEKVGAPCIVRLPPTMVTMPFWPLWEWESRLTDTIVHSIRETSILLNKPHFHMERLLHFGLDEHYDVLCIPIRGVACVDEEIRVLRGDFPTPDLLSPQPRRINQFPCGFFFTLREKA